jgi:ribosomal protein S18 acetylase RimI-like enzyme
MEEINRNTIKIRPMMSSDIFSILNIWWTDIPQKEMLASQLGGPADLSLIAEYKDRLAGFVLARAIYAGFPITGLGVIHFIAVNPDYRGHGIGSMLIDVLKINCRAERIETVRLLVPQHETKLMKYFEKLGFSPSVTINLDTSVYPDYQL